MSTSQQAFEQVRSILSKLDRDIDAARQRRLHTGAEDPSPATATATVHPGSPARTEPPSDPGQSGYGRARPLRRDPSPNPFAR